MSDGILGIIELTIMATGGFYKIITEAECVAQLTLHSSDRLLHLYMCLHFSQLLTVTFLVCVCVVVSHHEPEWHT